jgi:hypothetical protein
MDNIKKFNNFYFISDCLFVTVIKPVFKYRFLVDVVLLCIQ